MADNIQVIRIPELPDKLTNNNSLYIPVWDETDDKTYKILSTLIDGGTDTTLAWKPAEIYEIGDIRVWNLKLWKSKVDANEGNIPAENEFWTEVSKAEGGEGLNYWNTGVYTINPSVVIYENNLYLLNNSVVKMPFPSVNLLNEFAENKWIKLTRNNNLISIVSAGTIGNDFHVPNIDDTLLVLEPGTIGISDGSTNLFNLSVPEPSYVIKTGAGFTASDYSIIPVKDYINDLPQASITGLVNKLIELEQANPVRYVRFLRSTTSDYFGETYYDTTKEEGTAIAENVTKVITAGTSGTANFIAQFAGIAVPPDVSFSVNQLNIDILAKKNATSRTVSIFFEVYNLSDAGVLDLLGTSNILTLTVDFVATPLFVSLGTPYAPAEGDRAVLIVKSFQTGEGVTAQTSISFDNQTGSRWSYETVAQLTDIGHVIIDNLGNLLPQQPALKAGFGLDAEDDDTNEQTILKLIADSDDIPDNFDRDNIGTASGGSVAEVIAAIDDNIGLLDTSEWEPETFAAAATEHPRWGDSLDAEIYGRDTFGFNALPGGSRNSDGTVGGVGNYGYWWSATESDTDFAWFRYMDYNSRNAGRNYTGKELGHSIRLVRPYTIADGEQINGRILVDDYQDYDGNNYDAVIIGDQVWLTSNLKTKNYEDGTPIPTGHSDVDWSNLTTGAYAVYPFSSVAGIDSEAEMIAAYGLLYNWYAVDNAGSLASGTYTVPTDAQFTELTDYIIATYPEIDATNIGDHLKSVRQVNSPFDAPSDKYLKPKLNLADAARFAKDEHITHDAALGNIGTAANELLKNIITGIDTKLGELSGLPSTWETNIAAIRALTTHDAGMDVGNYATGIIYEFDTTSTAADDGVDVLKPDNIAIGDPGRWVNKINFVEKAATFNLGTLKKFDINGNDADSGLTGESLDIYDVSAALITELTTESNWVDGSGNPILTAVTFASGIKGQRYYSSDFFFECFADLNWRRTYQGRPAIDIYNNPNLTLTEKSNLENVSNWSGKAYIGTAITDVAAGTRYYDNDYVYEFVQTNIPVRYSRI
jgi:uncharacterized protein (TIGR02145 family)